MSIVKPVFPIPTSNPGSLSLAHPVAVPSDYVPYCCPGKFWCGRDRRCLVSKTKLKLYRFPPALSRSGGLAEVRPSPEKLQLALPQIQGVKTAQFEREPAS